MRIVALGGVATFCLSLSAGLPDPAFAQHQGARTESTTAALREGDVLVHQEERGWSVVKVIAVDPHPGGRAVVHCLLYAPSANRPTMDALKSLAIIALHAPISASGFDGWERIGAAAVTKDESAGFVEYLKRTDFRRYAKHTGQEVSKIISRANRHYAAGNALNDAGRRIEAISEFDQAVALFPLFYEAIDNRAFTLMELGRYREALVGFEQSLDVNPAGLSAFFSKGECLMRLGDLSAAEVVFREGQDRFPERRQLFAEFLGKVKAMQAQAN